MMPRATQKSPEPGLKTGARALVPVAVCLAGLVTSPAEEPLPPDRIAHVAYQAAEEQFERTRDNPHAAWQYGRACFDWAEFSTNDIQRAELARKGIEACERALEKESESAAAHYYLGMNQGQLARTMSLGALKLVHQMEEHFRKAQELEPEFDQGGPDRNLGLLYLEAPGWPVSLGNRSRAQAHLAKAVELAPTFPENRLVLMEAYARWNERGSIEREMKAWEEHFETARKKYSGKQWYWDWLNWEQRFEVVKQQLVETSPHLRSPKDQG